MVSGGTREGGLVDNRELERRGGGDCTKIDTEPRALNFTAT